MSNRMRYMNPIGLMITKYCQNRIMYDLMNQFKILEEKAAHTNIMIDYYYKAVLDPWRAMSLTEMEKYLESGSVSYLSWVWQHVNYLTQNSPRKVGLAEVLKEFLNEEMVLEAKRYHKRVIKYENGEYGLNRGFEEEWLEWVEAVQKLCVEERLTEDQIERVKTDLKELTGIAVLKI